MSEAKWKLAPEDPTPEMLAAGRWSGAGDVSVNEEWARRECYVRMLSAAPQPPQTAEAELEAMEREHLGDPDRGTGIYAALSSRPVQGVDVDALAQFIRSLKEWYSMSAGQLAERIAAWLSSAPAREQWQPIETAPAERGIYLVRIGDQTHIAQFDPRMSSAKWWHPYGLPARLERQPTHWMPLPAAPGATAEPVKVREPMSEEQLGDAATGIKPYPMGLVLVPSEQLIAFARAIERHHGICKE